MTAADVIDADLLAPKNVLVVDDDPGINRLLQVRLKNLGYTVDSATNGEEALQSIADQQPDLMLLDVSMPGMGGMEVLSSIRQRELDIAVIMTTAFGSERVAIDALRNGANDYLRKPFESEEFRAVVARTASRLQLERQNQLLRERLDAELQRAAGIQRSLLPRSAPTVAGYDIAAVCLPARHVGGDFYDWHQRADGRITLTLGDVMGKGMPAALLMATVRAAIRSVTADRTPAGAVDAVSRAIANDLDRTASFVTLFHSILTPETGELEWVDAGHGLVVRLTPAGDLSSITQTDLPVGIVPDGLATTSTWVIDRGETIIICSDGLADTVEELATVPALRDAGSLTAESIIAHLVLAARERGTNDDDRTAIVIKRGGVQG